MPFGQPAIQEEKCSAIALKMFLVYRRWDLHLWAGLKVFHFIWIIVNLVQCHKTNLKWIRSPKIKAMLGPLPESGTLILLAHNSLCFTISDVFLYISLYLSRLAFIVVVKKRSESFRMNLLLWSFNSSHIILLPFVVFIHLQKMDHDMIFKDRPRASQYRCVLITTYKRSYMELY